MDSGISLIKSLATTLLAEIDALNDNDNFSIESGSFDLVEKVREFEIKLIKAALLRTQGNQRRAAFMLGVKVTTLHNKIKTYRINSIKLAID